MTSPIPSLVFDTDLLPPQDRFEHFRQAVSDFDVSPADAGGVDGVRVYTAAWMLGDMLVTRGTMSPMRFVRTRRKAMEDGEDRYSLLLLTSGTWTGEVDGATMTIGPGQVGVFDLSRPMDGVGTEIGNITMGIARAAFAGSPLPDLHGRVLEGAPGRLAVDHLLALAQALPLASAADVPTIAQTTTVLFAHCFATLPPQAAEAKSDRLVSIQRRVRRYIDAHLGTPALTPDRICKDVAVSRSTLYRAFAPIGGVASYVQTRRLEAAHSRLAGAGTREHVASVGYAFGFASDAQFNKAFRRRFGFTPGEARRRVERALREGDAASTGALYRAWVKSLARE